MGEESLILKGCMWTMLMRYGESHVFCASLSRDGSSADDVSPTSPPQDIDFFFGPRAPALWSLKHENVL